MEKRSIVSVCLSLEFGGIVLYLDCLLVLAFSFIRAMQSPCIQSYDCCIKLQVTQQLKMTQTISRGWKLEEAVSHWAKNQGDSRDVSLSENSREVYFLASFHFLEIST